MGDIVCHRCWVAEHPRPRLDPADIDGGHDLLLAYLRYVRDLHYVELALEDGLPSLYEQHRDAYARTGDPAELKRMLRHVALEDGTPAGDVWVKTEPQGGWAVPWQAETLAWLALALAAFAAIWLAS